MMTIYNKVKRIVVEYNQVLPKQKISSAFDDAFFGNHNAIAYTQFPFYILYFPMLLLMIPVKWATKSNYVCVCVCVQRIHIGLLASSSLKK